MDQKLDSGTKRYDSGTSEGTEQKGKRLELSVPQVAGSALAAIAAAVLASQLDVYGTIIGAGVVSVIATCGGSIFHYLFRRTGDRLKDAAVQARPKGRQVLVTDGRPATAAGRELPDTLDVLGAGYGEATTHRSKRRGWRRPVLGAVVVFLVAMVCITGYELAAGHDLTGNARTTIGSVVGGGGGGGGGHHAPPPADPSKGTSGDGHRDGSTGTGGGADPSTSPDAGAGQGQQGKGEGDGQGSQSPGEHASSGAPTPHPSSSGSGGQSPSTGSPTPSVSAGTGASGQSDGSDGANGSASG